MYYVKKDGSLGKTREVPIMIGLVALAAVSVLFWLSSNAGILGK